MDVFCEGETADELVEEFEVGDEVEEVPGFIFLVLASSAFEISLVPELELELVFESVFDLESLPKSSFEKSSLEPEPLSLEPFKNQ